MGQNACIVRHTIGSDLGMGNTTSAIGEPNFLPKPYHPILAIGGNDCFWLSTFATSAIGEPDLLRKVWYPTFAAGRRLP